MPRKKGSKNLTPKAESCANPFVIASNLIEHNTRIFHLEKACSELGSRVLELQKEVILFKSGVNSTNEKMNKNIINFDERIVALEKSVFEVEPSEPSEPSLPRGGVSDSN